MTFYHFGNCLALAYTPYYFTYKFSGLSEYNAFWKCVTAGFLYMFTNLAKMLFLATFFSGNYDDDDFKDEEAPFEFFTEFLKLTIDLADIAGLYLVMQRIAGKGQVKVLASGLGWAFADLLLTRVIFLWVGARGIEFDWKYVQKSFDSNISLVHYLTLACLIYLGTRRDTSKSLLPFLVILVGIASYKTLLLDTLVNMFGLGVWTALFYKAAVTSALGLVSLQLYIGATANDKY